MFLFFEKDIMINVIIIENIYFFIFLIDFEFIILFLNFNKKYRRYI